MSGFTGIPFAIGTYSRETGHIIHLSDWFYIVCISLGILGPVVIGVGARGQDEPCRKEDSSAGNSPANS